MVALAYSALYKSACTRNGWIVLEDMEAKIDTQCYIDRYIFSKREQRESFHLNCLFQCSFTVFSRKTLC